MYHLHCPVFRLHPSKPSRGMVALSLQLNCSQPQNMGKIIKLGPFYKLITKMGLFHFYLLRGSVILLQSAYLRSAFHQNATRGLTGQDDVTGVVVPACQALPVVPTCQALPVVVGPQARPLVVA